MPSGTQRADEIAMLLGLAKTPSRFDAAVPRPPPAPEIVRVNGDLARRKPLAQEKTYWDSDLTGFGLRVRPNGCKSWVVKFVSRGRQRKLTLGQCEDLDPSEARQQARKILADVASAGLPKRQSQGRAIPTFAFYAEEFWRDYARHWKPATQATSRRYIDKELIPTFGEIAVDRIRRADVLRWRDDLVERQPVFNRVLPVLSVMMKYSEQLGYRGQGSNPCRNMTCYYREPKERFLSAVEYRRLATVLADEEARQPDLVAAIRLLVFTGARVSEVLTLRWEQVKPPRLHLADSKTGPKIIYLNSQAQAVLQELGTRQRGDWVFPSPRGEGPRGPINVQWAKLRRAAALPDVRLHDLRHSFASVAINQGISLVQIGRLLGHALIETTSRYAHLEDRSISEAAVRISRSVGLAMGLSR